MSIDNTEPGGPRDGRSVEIIESADRRVIKRNFPPADTAATAINDGMPTSWQKITKSKFHRSPQGTLIATISESTEVAQRDIQMAHQIENILGQYMNREKAQRGLGNFAGIDVASPLVAQTDTATGATVVAYEGKAGDVMPTTDKHEQAWTNDILAKLNLFFTQHGISAQLNADNILLEHRGRNDWLHIVSTGSFREAATPTVRSTAVKAAPRRLPTAPQTQPEPSPAATDPTIIDEPTTPTTPEPPDGLFPQEEFPTEETSTQSPRGSLITHGSTTSENTATQQPSSTEPSTTDEEPITTDSTSRSQRRPFVGIELTIKQLLDSGMTPTEIARARNIRIEFIRVVNDKRRRHAREDGEPLPDLRLEDSLPPERRKRVSASRAKILSALKTFDYRTTERDYAQRLAEAAGVPLRTVHGYLTEQRDQAAKTAEQPEPLPAEIIDQARAIMQGLSRDYFG